MINGCILVNWRKRERERESRNRERERKREIEGGGGERVSSFTPDETRFSLFWTLSVCLWVRNKRVGTMTRPCRILRTRSTRVA